MSIRSTSRVQHVFSQYSYSPHIDVVLESGTWATRQWAVGSLVQESGLGDMKPLVAQKQEKQKKGVLKQQK
jgi:hypothetical protein